MKITVTIKKEKNLKVPTITKDFTRDNCHKYDCELIKDMLSLSCVGIHCSDCMLSYFNVQDAFNHLKTLE